MSRTKSKHPKNCRKIGDRFILILENEFGSLSDAAAELGYVNPSTLYAIRDGRALPSHEKILIATELFQERHAPAIDLNWLFTGKKRGSEHEVKKIQSSSLDIDIIKSVNKLSDAQKRALKVLLSKKAA